MKTNKRFLRTNIAILSMVISVVWFLAAACSKGQPAEPEESPTEKEHVITMTTLAPEVTLKVIILNWSNY